MAQDMAHEDATPTYTPITWATGDVITAEKLNHMEDGITSAQVYSVSEDVRFSDSVTTEENGEMYSQIISCNFSDTPEQIKVVFDGTEYICEKVVLDGSIAYGGAGATEPDFSEYPFVIRAGNSVSMFFTETASTHQVEITAITKAVNEDLANAMPVMRLISEVTNSADAVAAFNAGKLLYFTYGGPTSFYIVTGIDTTDQKFIAIPDNGPNCLFVNNKIVIKYNSQ